MEDKDQPAQLSAGEHVIDAETVALLGEGNTEAGHARLEELKRFARSRDRGDRALLEYLRRCMRAGDGTAVAAGQALLDELKLRAARGLA